MRDHLKNQFGATEDRNTIKNSAFVILYTNELRLWENHQEKLASVRENTAPAFLMVRRSDYMMGFPGGGLKNTETPIQGAVQELKEELGLTFLHESRLAPLSRQQFTNTHGTTCVTHCFMAEINAQEFKDILENAHKAEHFMAETRGLIPVSMEHTAKEKPLPFKNFLHSPMAPSVRQDISDFLLRSRILEPDIMRDLINAKLLPEPTKNHTAAEYDIA